MNTNYLVIITNRSTMEQKVFEFEKFSGAYTSYRALIRDHNLNDFYISLWEIGQEQSILNTIDFWRD